MKQDSVKLKIENENQKSKAEKMTKVQTWSLASLYCSERFVYKLRKRCSTRFVVNFFQLLFLLQKNCLTQKNSVPQCIMIAWFQTKNWKKIHF